MIAVVVIVLGAFALTLDFEPDLEHVDIGVVSGSEQGHYFAQVDLFGRRAARDGGSVRNIATAGSGENLRRLESPGDECEVDFGLVQDGSGFEEVEDVEVIARLPRGEVLLFLGSDAEGIAEFRDLAGKTIGAGPRGSGTAALVDALFALPGFDSLGVTLRHAPIADQITAAAAGDLDLAAVVVYEDADLVRRAVHEQHLAIASFRSASAVASQLAGVHATIIESGHYDAVRSVPDEDRHVLSVDTLILASTCARRSEINAILSVLGHELPGFIEQNRNAVEPHGLVMSSVATEYFDNHGPPLVDEYLPQIVDVIPLSNFMTFVMAISVLFNIMSVLNRFQLWRLDTRRSVIEGELRELFGGGITRGEIALLDPNQALLLPAERERLSTLTGRLRDLLEVCRRQTVSMLVPMGQEMVYRYQEDLMIDTLAVLRRFRSLMPEHGAGSGAEAGSESGSASGSVAEAGSVAESGAESESGFESESGSESVSVSESVSESESESGSESESESDFESESGSESESESESESGAESDSVA